MKIKHLFTKLIAMGLVSAMIFSTDISVLAQEVSAPVVASEEVTEAETTEEVLPTEEALPAEETEAVTEVAEPADTEEPVYEEEETVIEEEGTEVVVPDTEEPEEEICTHEGEITETIKKATLTADGSVTRTCADCGELIEKVILRKPVEFTLSKTLYTYTGSACKPLIKVYDVNGDQIPTKYYTVTYSKYISIGNPTATLKFDEKYYSGTKTFTYKIRPKKTSITSLTESKTKNSITVKWSKVTTKTSGYQIQYSTSSTFSTKTTLTISDNTVSSKTITGLAYGKTYYVRVRTYYQPASTKYVSSWSATESVKTYTKDKIAAVKVTQEFLNYAKTWDCANMNRKLRGTKTSAFPYPQSIVFDYLLSKNQTYYTVTPVKCTASATTATVTMKIKYRNYYAPCYIAYYDLAYDMAVSGTTYSDTKSFKLLKEYIIAEAKGDYKPYTDTATISFKASKVNGVWKVKDVPDEFMDVLLCRFVSASDDIVNEM